MQHVNRSRTPALVLASIFLLTQVLAASAQSQSHLHIHDTPAPQPVTTSGGAVGLSFETAFSLLDSEDQVLTAFEIADAAVELEGESYTAVVQELETPWTLVILVDTSKNLGSFIASSAFRELRTSLASAVNGAPEGANIAVMTFNDAVDTVFNFEQEKDKAAEAIDRLRARTSGNSCLNNGLYEAVNRLAGAPGRRAVIVATASLDDCANRTLEDVLSLAEANRVQIYAVGLQGYSATLTGLEEFTGPSGGLADLRNEGNLVFGFSNIFAVLQNQWTARATIYPSAGNQSANLVVNLTDESSMTSEPITFVSSQDYLPPAEIELLGTVQSLADGIIFNLGITQKDKIRQLNVSVVSKDTGQSVLSQSLLSFSDTNRIPTVSLMAGLEYTLTVTAVDFDGQVLSETELDFTYEPPQAALIIAGVTPPAVGGDSFEVTFSAQNLADAVKFRGWISTDDNGPPIEGTLTTVPLGEPLLLPTTGIRGGDYFVFVQGLDASDTVLAESAPFELTYQPAGIFQRLGNWASNSPIALAGVTALCCLTSIGLVVIFYVVLPKRGGGDAEVDLVMPERAKPAKSRPPRPDSGRARTPEIKRPDSGRAHTPEIKRPPPRPTPKPQKPESKPPVRPEPVVEKPRPPASPAPTPAGPPAAGALARLKLVEPKSASYSVDISQFPFRVGRKKDIEGALPLGSSSGVSSHHMTIQFTEGIYFVKDEDSTYGTTVNNEEVPKGKARQLHNGDVIGLGPMVKVEFTKFKKEA